MHFYGFIIVLLTYGVSLSAATAEHDAEESKKDYEKIALEMLQEIRSDNTSFMKKHKKEYFSGFMTAQHPRVTLVMCADSRCQIHALDDHPDNNVFNIRNIGNQLATSEGSIEYGVRHLDTPLLLFVGHTACGAVTAATKGFSTLEPAIRAELKTLKVPLVKKNPTAEELLSNIEANVNNQVAAALKKFSDLVGAKKLMVVGAIYDFTNEYEKGNGKVRFINISGNTATADIKEFETKIRKVEKMTDSMTNTLFDQVHSATDTFKIKMQKALDKKINGKTKKQK